MKTIKIFDGMSHVQVALTLTGSELTGDRYVADLLTRNGLSVREDMPDAFIAQAIYDAYAGDGYEGDPQENGLRVYCGDEVAA